MANQFSWTGFGLRFMFAFIIVFATYNPEGYSFYHWGIQDFFPIAPTKIVVALLLLIGWVIYIRATMRSLGGVGLILTAGLCAAVLWMLVDWGWIHQDSVRVISYAALMIITIILSVGMSWSHVRRRMSGQYDMDDVEEES